MSGRLSATSLLALLCACTAAPTQLAWESASSGAADLRQLGCVAVQVPPDATRRAQLVQDLTTLGVSRVRWELTWASVEQVRSVYDFTLADAGIQALLAAGLEPLIAIVGGNPLYSAAGRANGNDQYYPPDDPNDFARYAAAVAARFSAPGRVFEIWNEENAGYRFWKPAADARAYAALFNAARASVQAACPLCKVIVGGPVSDAYPSVPAGALFLADAADAGLAGADGQGVHAYSLYPPCSPPEGGRNLCAFWTDRSETPAVTQLRDLQEASGGLPTFITEVGWPTATSITDVGSVTEELQARWLIRLYLLAAAEGTGSVCWWTWSDDARSGQFPPEGDFGLVKQSGAPKLAFGALADLLHELRLVHFIRDRATELGLLPGEHALLFALDSAVDLPPRLATFLWREEATPSRAVKLKLHGPSTLRQVGASGTGTALPGPAAQVTLDVQPQVIISGKPG